MIGGRYHSMHNLYTECSRWDIKLPRTQQRTKQAFSMNVENLTPKDMGEEHETYTSILQDTKLA